jgi:hypothetical protein
MSRVVGILLLVMTRFRVCNQVCSQESFSVG